MMTKKLKTAAFMVAVASGLAFADGPWVVYSADTALDTRGKATLIADADEEVDARSYSEDLSEFSKIDTRINRGTLFTIR
ncbi:MAG: hypothetical protein PHX41_13720 [Kiritimatiellae bacterium]|nr:hypothetical protein [Kiritimatiellia bacterium]